MTADELLAAQNYARATVVRMLRRFPSDVEDVLQSATVRAITHLDQFRGECDFRTWFMSITIRTALMWLRARKIEVSRGVSLEEALRNADNEATPMEIPDHKPDPLELAILAQRKAVVHAEIGKLSPYMREEGWSMLREEQAGCDNRRKSQRFRMRNALRPRLLARGLA
jgi:RNA polymerase sigma factor (sigma-70 family)